MTRIKIYDNQHSVASLREALRQRPTIINEPEFADWARRWATAGEAYFQRPWAEIAREEAERGHHCILPVARTRIHPSRRRWAARCAAIRGGNAKWASSIGRYTSVNAPDRLTWRAWQRTHSL